MPMDALGCVGGTGVTALTRRVRRAVDECMKLSTTKMALKTHGILNVRFPPPSRVSLTTSMIESAGHGKAAVRLAALVLMGDVEKIATFQPPF